MLSTNKISFEFPTQSNIVPFQPVIYWRYYSELMDERNELALENTKLEQSRDCWQVRFYIAAGLLFFTGFALLLSRGVLNP